MSYLQDLLGDAYKEGMTEDEISTALEGMKSEPDDISHYKNLLSKANSEASKYKKQLRERMSEEEAARAASEEERTTLLEENKVLHRQIDISDKTTRLLALGYDKDLAGATAIAMVDNDFETVIANQSKFLEAQKQSVLKAQMQNTPRPVGSSDGSVDYKKHIEQARANGNMSEVAYWTRLENEANNTQE